MGEVLGLGLTHFPPLGWPDDTMDRALQFGFADPSVPDAVRQGEGWPEGMREEFDRRPPRGRGRAPGCARRRVRRGARPRSTSSRPTSSSSGATTSTSCSARTSCPRSAWSPRRRSRSRRGANSSGNPVPNVWDEDPDTRFELRGPSRVRPARWRPSLLHDDVDVAYAYTAREDRPFPHAVSNTVLFLDYHRRGFPYAVVPMTVNCYGELAVSRRGGMVRFDADGGRAAARPAQPVAATLHRPSVAPSRACRWRRQTCASRWSRRRAGRTASCTTPAGASTPTTRPTGRSTTSLVDGEHEVVARRDARSRSSSRDSRRC